MIILGPVVDNFKSARSLGNSAGELLESTLLDAAGDAQLLELDRQLVVELILPVIFSNASFSSKVQEFRKEVMELVINLHVQLLELVFCSGNTVRVAIDRLQVVKHIV